MVLTIINGPNLNLLGSREKDIYGSKGFEEFLDDLKIEYPDIQFIYFQSNVEGEIVNAIQKAAGECDGILLNAAAYTHTSVAIADAVAAINIPVLEIHISNVLTREEYRHTSLIGPVCSGTIFGFGLNSYKLAAEAFARKFL